MPRKKYASDIDTRGDKIRTKQSAKNECDINQILARYLRTGVVSPENMAKRQAVFGDVSETPDFHAAQNQVIAAKDAFMTLPAKIRSRFANDPGQLLDFCADPNNRDEAIELGIITKIEEETPPEPPPEGPTTPPET